MDHIHGLFESNMDVKISCHSVLWGYMVECSTQFQLIWIGAMLLMETLWCHPHHPNHPHHPRFFPLLRNHGGKGQHRLSWHVAFQAVDIQGLQFLQFLHLEAILYQSLGLIQRVFPQLLRQVARRSEHLLHDVATQRCSRGICGIQGNKG